jgi:adenosylhomocysteine nucleosidase
MKTGIIVAMQSEFDLVKGILHAPVQKQHNHITFIEGTIDNNTIVLMKSGIGKVNAACACVEMINNFKPDIIINTGLAGGIDKSLSVMDIVLASKTTYHDVWCGEECQRGQVPDLPAEFEGDKKLIKVAQNIETDLKIHTGLIVGGDVFVTDIKTLNDIKAKFPSALAVDMESTAISQVCYLYNVPFLAIRIISDTPGIENHYEQYFDFWNKAPEKSVETIKQILLNYA